MKVIMKFAVAVTAIVACLMIACGVIAAKVVNDLMGDRQ